MTPFGREILLWSTIGFCVLLWCPLTMFWLSLYYKHRFAIGIRQRHYKIVLLMGVIFLYAFLIDRPIALIDDSNVYNISSSVLHTVHYISFPIQVHALKLALLWRYFAVYFDLNFAVNVSHSKWKSIISVHHDETDWFLTHKKTYGNFHWQSKRYFIIWITLSLLTTTIRNIYQFNAYPEYVASIFHGLLIFLYAPVLICLYTKMPQINDVFYIKKEIEYITLIFISQFIVYFVSIVLKEICDWDDFMLQMLWSVSGMFAASLYLYIFTVWTLSKCIWNIDQSTHHNIEMMHTLNSVPSLSYTPSNNLYVGGRNSQSLSTVKSEVSTMNLKICLFDALKDSRGYQCFMHHLMHEWSHETLLSFTEMIEWKTAMKQVLADVHVIRLAVNHGKRITTQDILLFEFPDIVPLSSIVDDDALGDIEVLQNRKKAIHAFKHSAYRLFTKYIYSPSDACEYEINVSYGMRNPLIEKMGSYGEWMASNIGERELFCMFDECIMEMYELMNDSFVRFKSTPQFYELRPHLQKT